MDYETKKLTVLKGIIEKEWERLMEQYDEEKGETEYMETVMDLRDQINEIERVADLSPIED